MNSTRASAASPLQRFATRAFGVEPALAEPLVAGFTLFFLLFAGYFMLRPVRETMGVAGGVENLQWLFTATFVVTLAAMPLFGWLAARVPRRTILAWTYVFFASNLLAFAGAFALAPDNLWFARAFYVWISMFNLVAISVAWSVMADVFTTGEAKRGFALVAAGASAGGLAGPALGIALVGVLGHAGLLVLSAALLLAAIAAAQRVRRWRERTAPPGALAAADATAGKRLGGNPFEGLAQVLRSPYLVGIAAFVLLLASVTTFLYFEQARLVEANFPDRADQTRVFGTLDFIVQSLTIVAQLFVTGHIARRLGVGVLLVGVPLVVVVGFVWLAASPVFAVLAVVMVVRRAGEYAFVRPGREMLFTLVAPAEKYKAKNFIDAVVYRGGDAVSGWAKHLVDAVASQPAVAALIGAGIALTWAGTGAGLAHAARRREARALAVPSPEVERG